jgi:hypothetical protein
MITYAKLLIFNINTFFIIIIIIVNININNLFNYIHYYHYDEHECVLSSTW